MYFVIHSQIRDALAARFDGRESYCAECNGQAQLFVPPLVGDSPRIEEASKWWLSYGARGFCCTHMRDKARKAFAEALEQIEACRRT